MRDLLWAVQKAFGLSEIEALKKLQSNKMGLYKELEETTGIKKERWRDYAKKPLSKQMIIAVELVECKRELKKVFILLAQKKHKEAFSLLSDKYFKEWSND